MFELKPLSKEAVPRALEKAERYRLLNEPWQAESICRDVLEADPENPEALVMLLLALTDQFDHGMAEYAKQARQIVPRLRSEYERAYYGGIICERQAKAHLNQRAHGTGYIAYQWLGEAMRSYERAEAVRPPGNDDAILRWNTCARMIMGDPRIAPMPEGRVEAMME